MSHVDDLVRLGVRMPARYAGGEFFVEPPSLPEPGDIKVALVFPDAYEIGMSNAGLAILYSMLRQTPGIFVDRFFVPWMDMEAHIRAGRVAFGSRDHGLPLGRFDVVGISLPFELTYTGILTVLDLGGIPFRAADRGPTEPLVIAGGPGAAHPEPVAPFFDARVERGMLRFKMLGLLLESGEPDAAVSKPGLEVARLVFERAEVARLILEPDGGLLLVLPRFAEAADDTFAF